jgi:hypothetical protein
VSSQRKSKGVFGSRTENALFLFAVQKPGDNMAVTLATIDAAITSINDSGQSFTLDGMTYSKGNIDKLIALRTQLQKEDERSGDDRPAVRGFNFTGAAY